MKQPTPERGLIDGEEFTMDKRGGGTENVLARRLVQDTNLLGPNLRVGGFAKAGEWLIQRPDGSQTTLSEVEFKKRCTKCETPTD